MAPKALLFLLILPGFLLFSQADSVPGDPKGPPCQCGPEGPKVCGSDGKEYHNVCELKCAQGKNPGVSLIQVDCPKSSSQVSPGPQESSLPTMSKIPQLRLLSVHIVRQKQCICSRQKEPVCGSNGKIFPNDCQLACAQEEDPRLKEVRCPEGASMESGESHHHHHHKHGRAPAPHKKWKKSKRRKIKQKLRRGQDISSESDSQEMQGRRAGRRRKSGRRKLSKKARTAHPPPHRDEMDDYLDEILPLKGPGITRNFGAPKKVVKSPATKSMMSEPVKKKHHHEEPSMRRGEKILDSDSSSEETWKGKKRPQPRSKGNMNFWSGLVGDSEERGPHFGRAAGRLNRKKTRKLGKLRRGENIQDSSDSDSNEDTKAKRSNLKGPPVKNMRAAMGPPMAGKTAAPSGPSPAGGRRAGKKKAVRKLSKLRRGEKIQDSSSSSEEMVAPKKGPSTKSMRQYGKMLGFKQ